MGHLGALRPRPRGVTIGRLMLVSVVVAIAGWAYRADPMRSRWEQWLLLAAGGLVLIRIGVLILFAKQCPACGKPELGRVAARSFGDHYFRCAACGQRAKRNGLGRMWDASGPEDDRFFRKERPVRTWADGPIDPAEETPETRTTARLLRGKIDRDAQAPEPVEIVPGDLRRSGGTETAQAVGRPAARTRPLGVKDRVAETFFRTLESIRWSRSKRS